MTHSYKVGDIVIPRNHEAQYYAKIINVTETLIELILLTAYASYGVGYTWQASPTFIDGSYNRICNSNEINDKNILPLINIVSI